jgi:hypothetical protein
MQHWRHCPHPFLDQCGQMVRENWLLTLLIDFLLLPPAWCLMFTWSSLFKNCFRPNANISTRTGRYDISHHVWRRKQFWSCYVRCWLCINSRVVDLRIVPSKKCDSPAHFDGLHYSNSYQLQLHYIGSAYFDRIAHAPMPAKKCPLKKMNNGPSKSTKIKNICTENFYPITHCTLHL